MVLIRRHVAKPVDEAVVRSWLSTTVLTLIMGAVVAIVMNYMWVEDGEWLDSIYCLAACVASGSLTFLLGSVVMRMPELHWFMGRKT